VIWLYDLRWWTDTTVGQYLGAWLFTICFFAAIYGLAYIGGWVAQGWRALRRRT
jgi:hypothetical protein